ncbi:MAG: DNA replication complex GINS family protein [Thermoplasmata archaeon]|nr:DNA replication complex GINS family protein [Thermoplasmata archaeon]
MSPVVQPMTFEELCQIHREEMKARGLTPCRADLYKAIADLLNRLRQDYDRQIAIDPDSVMSEGANLRRKNADSISKVIISLRTKKVCNKAILSADGGNEQLDTLTPEERSLYEQMVAVARRHMSTVDRLRGKKTIDTHIDEPMVTPVEDEISEPIVGEPSLADILPMDDQPEMFDDPIMEESFDDIPEPEDISPQQPAEEPEPLVEVKAEEQPVPADYVVLRVLEDLPPFVGPDRDYELRKEDIVTLPAQMAAALINSNKAVAVNPSHRSSSCPLGTRDNLC